MFQKHDDPVFRQKVKIWLAETGGGLCPVSGIYRHQFHQLEGDRDLFPLIDINQAEVGDPQIRNHRKPQK